MAGGASQGRREQAARILEILAGADFERLARLADGIRRGHDSFQAGWRESLADLSHQMSGVRRRLAEVAQQTAADRALSAKWN